MDKIFSDEINLLKALAIMLVVSGHLEFSLLGIFPPYSFQLALFFFISGCLFKVITVILMKLHGVPIAERANHDIYWIYNPIQTTYLYFVVTMIATTYIGVGLKKIHNLF